jgi:hypothetical protein
MKKSEFSAAAALAFDHSKSLEHVDDSGLFGCGLADFKPIFVTTEQVAKFIRWQCTYLFGGHDIEELANCADIAREKFTLIQAHPDAPLAEWLAARLARSLPCDESHRARLEELARELKREGKREMRVTPY